MLIEPIALQLRIIHLLRTSNGAAALWRVAEAFEGLGHFPFGRWIEELF